MTTATIRGALADPEMLVAGTAAVPRWLGAARPRGFPPELDWVVGCSYTGEWPIRRIPR